MANRPTYISIWTHPDSHGDWLVDSDRGQVKDDLLGVPGDLRQATRARSTTCAYSATCATGHRQVNWAPW